MAYQLCPKLCPLYTSTAGLKRVQSRGARTFADYTNLLEGYVRPALGNRELSKLTPLDIQAIYTDLIFATTTGEPLHEHNIVNRHFKPILNAAGLAKCFRLYDLRHSCATLLLAQGEHPKVVSGGGPEPAGARTL